MKRSSLLSVCLAVLLLPLMSQENLFKNADFAGKAGWTLIGKTLDGNAGEMKLNLARDRKEFMDGGIGQRIQQPKEGYYNVSLEFKSEGVNTVSFWNQICLKSGKYQYRVKTIPLKAAVTQFRKEEFTFDIPADAAWVYVQVTGRSAHNEKNAVIEVKKPVFRTVSAPVSTAVQKVQKVPWKKMSVSVQPEKYLTTVTKSIPAGHPRLFYSPEIYARMKKMARDPEVVPYIETLKQNVLKKYQNHLDCYKSDDGLGPNEPLSRRYHPLENWGRTAAESAILYRLTDDRKWADIAIDLMKKLTPWYNKRFSVNRAVSWYGWGRVHTMMAWDWLYDVMNKADRDEIAGEMIAHAKKLNDRKLLVKLNPLGEGNNSTNSGFYSANNMLPWYLGIALWNEGYDDKFVEAELRKGLEGHLQMLAYRNTAAGDDGGSINSTPAYCYGTYNWVEFYFFISYQAVTGRNIAADFPQMGLFPFWLSYTLFRGIDGRMYDFGTGGAWHLNNVYYPFSAYHSLYRNFYSGPLCDISDELNQYRRENTTPYYSLMYHGPFYIFFMNCDLKNVKDNSAFYRKLPKGYFFENLGQVYMHSGRDTTSTRAMFTCGAKSASHKECDENNFVIYKGGFLALDSGTRTFDFTSKGREMYYDHDSNYKSQAVAHNVVLIRMEGEKFRGWRIDPKKVVNHEGMIHSTGGIVRAFETNPDFTYIAGDSTACYNPGKAKQVVRQFLMVYPDVFVIYDTVKSVKADQKKTWLLHTQEEPVINGDTFEVVQREGRLICRTLLPADASLEKIGGPGKEFWSDGKNHHPGVEYLEKSAASARKAGYDAPLWGHWRMEIRNPKAVADETFLHVIQVGLKKDFQKMIGTKLIREGNMDGVSFRYNDVDCTITFDRSKVPAGHIKAVKNGKVLHDRAFSGKIQPLRAADYLK